jgi:hypothetical protein
MRFHYDFFVFQLTRIFSSVVNLLYFLAVREKPLEKLKQINTGNKSFKGNLF